VTSPTKICAGFGALNEDGFNQGLMLVKDKEDILCSDNPGLELALRGVYDGPIIIKSDIEQEKIVKENKCRIEQHRSPISWSWKECINKRRLEVDMPIEKCKNARFVDNHEHQSMMSALAKGVQPGVDETDYKVALPPNVDGLEESPMETIIVSDGTTNVFREVLHHEKIKELYNLVKYSKEPLNSTVHSQLMKIQALMDDCGYNRNEDVRAATFDLALIAQNENVCSKMGDSYCSGNIRVCWSNVLNSFLRKDKVMFGVYLRVLLYHLESGN
jgi:hypothetical protein